MSSTVLKLSKHVLVLELTPHTLICQHGNTSASLLTWPAKPTANFHSFLCGEDIQTVDTGNPGQTFLFISQVIVCTQLKKMFKSYWNANKVAWTWLVKRTWGYKCKPKKLPAPLPTESEFTTLCLKMGLELKVMASNCLFCANTSKYLTAIINDKERQNKEIIHIM